MRFLSAVISLYLLVQATALQLDILSQRKARLQSYLGQQVASVSGLNNTADIGYYVRMMIGGMWYTLLVDTGSSDFWIAGDVPGATNTSFSGNVAYADGFVTGQIKIAQVNFLGYTILDQAFLQVVPDGKHKNGYGIIGLGPNSGSNLFREMGGIAGTSLVDRIVLQNRTIPDYLTFLLGRSEDFTVSDGGSLTMGTIINGYEGVLSQPKLPVVNVDARRVGNQHFQILLDVNGLIGPDGKPIPTHSSVANQKQATVLLDTGFSLPQVPDSVAAAIYGRFVNAEEVDLESLGKVWMLPCEQEVNITFNFGGRSMPIHPLDATIDPKSLGLKNTVSSNGQAMCIGTFQPFSYNLGATSSYDMVLGMAFLRNVYMLLNYGDFILGTDKKRAPYVQLLSTTFPNKAHRDFVKVRLNGTDNTGQYGIKTSPMDSFLVYYIVIGLVLAVVLTSIGMQFIHCARKGKDSDPINSDAVASPDLEP